MSVSLVSDKVFSVYGMCAFGKVRSIKSVFLCSMELFKLKC